MLAGAFRSRVAPLCQAGARRGLSTAAPMVSDITVKVNFVEEAVSLGAQQRPNSLPPCCSESMCQAARAACAEIVGTTVPLCANRDTGSQCQAASDRQCTRLLRCTGLVEPLSWRPSPENLAVHYRLPTHIFLDDFGLLVQFG